MTKNSFGTSESQIYGTQGKIKTIEQTLEMCTTCDGAAAGPTNFEVLRQDEKSVTLICPNCGEVKTVFPNEVKRKPNEFEQLRRSQLQRQADQARAEAEKIQVEALIAAKKATKEAGKAKNPTKAAAKAALGTKAQRVAKAKATKPKTKAKKK